MTDWAAFDFVLNGETVTITRQEVAQALNVANNSSLPPNGVFVRESFDRLFYRMGKIDYNLSPEVAIQRPVLNRFALLSLLSWH